MCKAIRSQGSHRRPRIVDRPEKSWAAIRASQDLHVTRVLSFPNANKKSVLQSLNNDPDVISKVLLHIFVQKWLVWDFEWKRAGDYGLVYKYFILMLNVTFLVLGVD